MYIFETAHNAFSLSQNPPSSQRVSLIPTLRNYVSTELHISQTTASFYCDPRLNQTERCFSAPGTAESEVQAQATEKRTTCILTKFTIVPKSERGSVDGVP